MARRALPRELQALAVLLVILGVAWVGYGLLFGEDAGSRLVIDAVQGEVRRVDGFGAESDAAAGQPLMPRDRIVAGAGGRAVLTLGPSSRVTVAERSALRVMSADESGVRLELEGGRVQATIRPGSGPVGITAEGRTVVTEDADFTAVRGEDGTFGVVTERGAVNVEGVPGAARLGEGERLVVGQGGSALVGPASEELLLTVAWPESARTRAEVTEVRGKTEPGATVRVGREGAWTVVKANASGEFVATARLTEGGNDVRVEATSVLGTSVAAQHTVVRDTTAPNVGVEIRY